MLNDFPNRHLSRNRSPVGAEPCTSGPLPSYPSIDICQKVLTSSTRARRGPPSSFAADCPVGVLAGTEGGRPIVPHQGCAGMLRARRAGFG